MTGWRFAYTPNPAEQTVVRCLFWLLVLFYGEPDLIGSIIAWIGRYPA
jgi:hypothetical protein